MARQVLIVEDMNYVLHKIIQGAKLTLCYNSLKGI
jgi:hypothetical protein